MLWWDDNKSKNCKIDSESVACHRTNGIVSIPRKISRKTSLPGFSSKIDTVKFSRKVSCPILHRAKECQIFCDIENVEEYAESAEFLSKYVSQPRADLLPKVCKPKLVVEKVETREP